ncbi:MAG: TerC family protein [Alphaproteobacteria bacterium]|nr:TerC family protein [Alphaproteobacteria bacterium]
MDFTFLTSPEALSALAQVIMIDIVLAADNAIVVGIAAAGVAPEMRARVIALGLGAAVLMRIAFAVVATQLLQIIGLMLAGGILLLWVSWRLYRELAEPKTEEAGAELAADHATAEQIETLQLQRPSKTFGTALTQIILADLSMSLDNVLAVAGAAMEHPEVLVIGLVLSVALMGAAATYIARLLNRYRWIGFVGLAVIAIVALRMIYEGGHDVGARLGFM